MNFIPNPINQFNYEQINIINDYIFKKFTNNNPINQKYKITNQQRIHTNFLQCIHPKFKKLFDDIYQYRIQVSKENIYNGIHQLLDRQYIPNTKEYTNTIYLLWNYGYGNTKSVINYNLLFLQKLFNLYGTQLYVTNYTPETLKTGEDIDDPINLSKLDIQNYTNILYTKHQQYFIFDDISYSGTQLMEDCVKWFDFIITNYLQQFSHITFTFNIFLYGITLNALLSFYKYIHHLQSTEFGNLIGNKIIFKLHYSKLLYSSIPFVFKRYIQIKLPNKVNNNLITNISEFNDIPVIYLSKYQKTMNILNQMLSSDLILFGDFYFANEMNEYNTYDTKRLQTLIYLDYKIPDTRSINDRLFYGFVPIYLLNIEYINQYKVIGTFKGYDVYQLQLFDEYKPFLENYIFKTISNTKIYNSTKLIDHNIEKPLTPWYKV